MDDPMPISYLALEPGTPVVTATGTAIGTVEHVLQIPAEDLFDGIVVTTDAGLRFVDRDQIAEITTAAVRCTLTDEEAAALPPPEGTIVLEADASKDTGHSLSDWFGRMFGRPRWTEPK